MNGAKVAISAWRARCDGELLIRVERLRLFIVSPLKGMPMAGGWNPKVVISTLMLNGTWGFGMALLMRLMNTPRQTLSYPYRYRGRS
jgi:hypothetical protein